MKPRILFGVLFHETHTFLPDPTRWSDFAVKLGSAILGAEGDESPTAGFLEEAKRFGWEVVPTPSQGSGVLRSMSEANALIVLSEDCGPVAAGEPVPVWLFEGLA